MILEGETANLMVLAEDLAQDPDLQGSVTIAITAMDRNASRDLQYGPLAQIVISLLTGVGSAAMWEAIKAHVARAQARGRIQERGESASADDRSPESPPP